MKKRRNKIIIAFIVYILAIIVPYIMNKLNVNFIVYKDFIEKFFFIISYLIVGFPILKKAFRNIFKGKVFDENFLMVVATIGAFAIGEFPEAVAVMLFYQIGELFQSIAVNKSRKSIASLMDIRPDFANVLRDDKEIKISPEEVNIGEYIVVKPGEKIPLDGKVVNGNSLIDTKALTGESVPRDVNVGNLVLSGTINLNSVLTIEVEKKYGESTVSKILDLVENASSKKSKSENFITKFARYYTPVVVIIAVLLAFIPPFLLGNFASQFSDWLYRALSFLVVSCPCALVISIPLSFFGGIGGASKMGILVKGSNYLETLSKAEVVVMDKTGTLTEGVFQVQKIKSKGITNEELIEIVAHAEYYSNHPIAKSIKQAYSGKIEENRIKEFKEISGNGISVKIDERDVLIGNEKLMKSNSINYLKAEDVGTILYVTLNKNFIGYILIADKIKEDAVGLIKKLKLNGIKKTIMLTGDRKEVGEDVARRLEIEQVYTELLPDGKVEKVEELIKQKSEKGKLIFVGDGINDSPVLAMSDIGIAMGALGSDSAIEAADVVIMTDEPSKIISALKVSKKTMRIVKENIIFAISIKILVLILSAFGLSTMWEAVFADVGVSIIAIINAFRMINIKDIK